MEALSAQEQELERINAHMIFLKRKLDRDIGYNYWKKYVSSAFWSHISTPINLVITFLTAITTAQAQTSDLLSFDLNARLAIVSLIFTTLNTFFRPHTQYASSTEYLGKWIDLGLRFEQQYVDKVDTLERMKEKVDAYEAILEEANDVRKTEGSGSINFVTDLIFMIAYRTCIRNHKRWLDFDKKIAKETETRVMQSRQSVKPFAQTSESSSEQVEAPISADV